MSCSGFPALCIVSPNSLKGIQSIEVRWKWVDIGLLQKKAGNCIMQLPAMVTSDILNHGTVESSVQFIKEKDPIYKVLFVFQGMSLEWQSYKLMPYVMRLAEAVTGYQEKVRYMQ